MIPNNINLFIHDYFYNLFLKIDKAYYYHKNLAQFTFSISAVQVEETRVRNHCSHKNVTIPFTEEIVHPEQYYVIFDKKNLVHINGCLISLDYSNINNHESKSMFLIEPFDKRFYDFLNNIKKVYYKEIDMVEYIRKNDFIFKYSTCKYDIFESLVHVNVCNTDLSECSDQLIQALPHCLTMLTLVNCKIPVIDSISMQHLIKLKKLNLCSNSIETIEFLRMNCKALKILNISHNRISSLNKKPIWSNIREIYLQFNNISYISRNVFCQLEHLEVLNLSNNELSSFTREHISGCNRLKSLHINRNKIDHQIYLSKLKHTTTLWDY